MKKSFPRRAFLAAVPLAGAASLTGTKASSAEESRSDVMTDDKFQPRLRKTEHVKTYYALARR